MANDSGVGDGWRGATGVGTRSLLSKSIGVTDGARGGVCGGTTKSSAPPIDPPYGVSRAGECVGAGDRSTGVVWRTSDVGSMSSSEFAGVLFIPPCSARLVVSSPASDVVGVSVGVGIFSPTRVIPLNGDSNASRGAPSIATSARVNCASCSSASPNPASCAGVLTGVDPIGVEPIGVLPNGVLPSGVRVVAGVLLIGVLPSGVAPSGVRLMGVLLDGVASTSGRPEIGVPATGVLLIGVRPIGVSPSGVRRDGVGCTAGGASGVGWRRGGAAFTTGTPDGFVRGLGASRSRNTSSVPDAFAALSPSDLISARGSSARMRSAIASASRLRPAAS